MAERIGSLWPDNSWTGLMTPARLQKARALYEERRRRNHACTLIDCLQLSDKAQVLMSDKGLLDLDFKTAGAAKRVIKDLEALRNNLAHAQDIVSDNWAQIGSAGPSHRRSGQRWSICVNKKQGLPVGQPLLFIRPLAGYSTFISMAFGSFAAGAGMLSSSTPSVYFACMSFSVTPSGTLKLRLQNCRKSALFCDSRLYSPPVHHGARLAGSARCCAARCEYRLS